MADDPAATSEPKVPPEGQAPSGDPPPGSGDPSSSPGPSLNDLAQQRAQGIIDRDIEMINTGRYPEISPKTVQLLEAYERTIGTGRGTAPTTAAPATPPATEPFYPAPAASEPDSTVRPLSELEKRGLEADRLKAAGELEAEVKADLVKRMWRTDAEAFFKELGDIEDFDPKDFALVDLTNSKEFPINEEGYNKWRGNATQLRIKYLNAGGKPASETPGSNETEKAAASMTDQLRSRRTKRQPAATTSGTPPGTLADAVKQRGEGKLSDQALRDLARKVLPGSGTSRAI